MRTVGLIGIARNGGSRRGKRRRGRLPLGGRLGEEDGRAGRGDAYHSSLVELYSYQDCTHCNTEDGNEVTAGFQFTSNSILIMIAKRSVVAT